jgi:hypothetical protein
VFPALALQRIAGWLERRAPARGRLLFYLVTAVYLGISGVLTWRDYFVRWPQQPEVQEIYQFTLTEAAQYAERRASSMPVAMSGLLEGDRDPYSVKHIRRSANWMPRWFDGRHALLLPGEGESLLVVPEYVPLTEPLRNLVVPVTGGQASLPTTSDGRPIFATYTGSLPSVLSKIDHAELGTVKWGASSARDPGEYGSWPSTPLPVESEDSIALYGYAVLTAPEPGAELQVLTLWRFWSTLDKEWVAFVHLIDAEGAWRSGYDRLDVEPISAQPGDVAIQTHRLAIPPDIAPGVYTLRAGIYERETLERLAWQVGPEATADHLILCRLEIP